MRNVSAVRRLGLPLVAVLAALLGTNGLGQEAVAQRAGQGPQSIAPIAKPLIPAVVNISTSQLSRGPKGVPLPDVPDGAPFEKFFDEFFEENGKDGGAARKVSSLGSGFVIDGKEGLVVTNNHVIVDADEIYINFYDGSKLKVDKVLGRDQKTDLALLKVTPKKPLAEVKFGSSDRLEVGDWVMAIGNPFGLGGSLTVGIISAKERDINSGPYDDFLQTDAAINKGNSGGPLFNMTGEVIGVNTAIISPTGGSIGIGFAVPSDTAVNVIEQLRLYGETRRGWLGVRIQSVSEDLAVSLGVAQNSGALVASVDPKGPAAGAGIKNGDVIVEFDGKPVSSMRSLPRLVAQTPIGKAVAVEVVRDGTRQSFDVEVGRLAEDPKPKAAGRQDPHGGAPGDDKPPASSTASGLPGVSVAVLDDDLRQQFKLRNDAEGLVVTSVDPDGEASKKGIREGDIIVEVAQTKVTDEQELSDAVDRVRKSGRKAVLLRLETAQGDLRFVAVPLE